MAGPLFWRARIRFDPPPAEGLWRDYFIDSTARWPAPTVRTWDGNRVEPRLEALILGLIVAEWEAAEAAVGPQQGVLL